MSVESLHQELCKLGKVTTTFEYGFYYCKLTSKLFSPFHVFSDQAGSLDLESALRSCVVNVEATLQAMDKKPLPSCSRWPLKTIITSPQDRGRGFALYIQWGQS